MIVCRWTPGVAKHTCESIPQRCRLSLLSPFVIFPPATVQRFLTDQSSAILRIMAELDRCPPEKVYLYLIADLDLNLYPKLMFRMSDDLVHGTNGRSLPSAV